MREFLKNAVKHTLIYGMGDFAQKIIGFVLLPIYMRKLTPEDYGILAMIGIASSLLGNLILQGIPTACFRAYCLDYSNDEQARSEVIGTSYLYLLMASFFYYSIMYHFSKDISSILFKKGDYTYYFKILFITDFLTCASNINFVVLRAKLLSLVASIISITRLVLGTTLNIVFVVYYDMKVEGILLANLIMSSIVFVLSPLIPIIIHKKVLLRISIFKLKEMLSFGLPFVPGTFGMWLLSSTDRYMLEHFSSTSDVGLYSLGFTFASIISFVFLMPLNRVLSPLIYSKVQDHDAKDILSRFPLYYLFVGSVIGLTVILGAENLIKIMGPKEYWDSYRVVPILVLNILLGTEGLQAQFNTGIAIAKKTIYMPVIVSIGAIFNLLFNLLFVPKYGMIGAAIATLLATIIMILITLSVNIKIYPLNYDYRRMIHLMSILVIIILINYKCNIDNFFVAIPVKIFMLIFYIFMLYATGFIKRSEYQTFKNEIQKLRNNVVSR